MDTFSADEIREQAIGNLIATYATTQVFLRSRGIDPIELERYFGEVHAPGWAEAKGDLEKIAHYVALNMQTFGFETETSAADGETTILARWSQEHDDPDWPISPRDALRTTPVTFEPIMAWLGIAMSWDATDDGLVFRLRAS
jgi:hypothetical protein